MTELVVPDPDDVALRPSERRDLQRLADAMKTGVCPCRGELCFATDDELVFLHQQLCPCRDRSVHAIEERVRRRYGRELKQTIIRADANAWKLIPRQFVLERIPHVVDGVVAAKIENASAIESAPATCKRRGCSNALPARARAYCSASCRVRESKHREHLAADKICDGDVLLTANEVLDGYATFFGVTGDVIESLLRE